jgi:hypothetical protein
MSFKSPETCLAAQNLSGSSELAWLLRICLLLFKQSAAKATFQSVSYRKAGPSTPLKYASLRMTGFIQL